MNELITITDSDSLLKAIDRVKKAQAKFAEFTQEQVDRIFKAAASAGAAARIPLARLAVDETKMGIIEDKVIKNHYASEYIYNAYKNAVTCGVVERDEALGTAKIAEPVGVITAVIPTTNPTSTAIFKALICLKTRNGIIFAPHPRAKKSTAEAVRILLEAAVKAGAPHDIMACIAEPSTELTGISMSKSDMILATGGPGMVKAAYSSGKPAIGVGAGNTPAIIDKSADIRTAVSSIIISKTFDNGVICASEQSVIVDSDIYDMVKSEFILRGCYFPDTDDLEKLRRIIIKDGNLNPGIVGQSACRIAGMAGISVPEDTKILIAETSIFTSDEPFAREKLSPVLAMYRSEGFDKSIEIADRLIRDGGFGHTASLFVNPDRKELIEKFSNRIKACRIILNSPAAHGGIGDLYNFGLAPSMTLGCGSWGGNSVSENVGIRSLLNYKIVAERKNNMQWFRAPHKVYFRRGCMPEALKELRDIYKVKTAFIVTDRFLYKNGYVKSVTRRLDELGIGYSTFYDINPDPTLSSALTGAKAMNDLNPDCIIAFGGGSAMDAAKLMWAIYENPQLDFTEISMRFMDIRKRILSIPENHHKALFVAIPTSSGTGSEVTPFTVITDEKNGIKYPIADYSLMPDIAVIDADMTMTQPKPLTAASGIDALTHALEAYVSVMASDYTDGIALSAIKIIFENLPCAYENGSSAPIAREKMADAATLAGMAFANAFLGLCHSMAHKLGAFHKLPHGVANALLITEVMKFNASEVPSKLTAFPYYSYPQTLKRYTKCAVFVGLTGENDTELFNALIERIDELKKIIGIKRSIRDYGISKSDFLATLDEMTEQAFDDQCIISNPRYPLMSEIKGIYLKAYYG